MLFVWFVMLTYANLTMLNILSYNVVLVGFMIHDIFQKEKKKKKLMTCFNKYEIPSFNAKV